MLNIFTYSDYREFIKDFYINKKSLNISFSYRYLAQKAGINSSSFYKYVIEGKRNLTKGTLLKTCQMLKLNTIEAEYFENLVFFNQAKTIAEKNHFFEKLILLRNSRDVYLVSEEQYDFYAEWYHPIIRELVSIIDFHDDYDRLAAYLSPSILPTQAKASVELLLRLGLIRKSEHGRYLATDSVITTGPGVKALQVINFQIKMMKMAIEVYDRFPRNERLMSSTTFGISEETFELFIKKCREFRSQLLDIARQDTNAQRVYQLNLNLFPVSKRGTRNAQTN